MPAYGERELKKDLTGEDVIELQVRLAGFRGTLPDGKFGPGTELQVARFQTDYMNLSKPTGVADQETMDAIDAFAEQFPIDLEALKCPCGVCNGFGQSKFKGRYRTAKPKIEAYYRYEYPGVHRMLLWAVRSLFLYMKELDFIFTSGYRCSVNNEQKKRSSTNHHGKAIDLDVSLKPGEDKRDDMNQCEMIRGLLVERSNAQIGWTANNRKSLEPANIAPTWIHYDVRSYDRRYLGDRFFCTTLEELDG
jgi:putative peptidoglycan binding protein